MNILYDGRIFKDILDITQIKNGDFFIAYNLLIKLIKNKESNIFLFLSKNDIGIGEKIFFSFNIPPVPIYTEDSDLSEINSFITINDVHPLFYKYPNISYYTLLNDITCLLYPDCFTNKQIKKYLNKIYSLNSFDYYFVTSKNSKDNFLNFYPQINPKNISTIKLGVDANNKQIKDRFFIDLYERYNIPKGTNYIFSLYSSCQEKFLIHSIKNYIEFIKKNNIKDLLFVIGKDIQRDLNEKLKHDIPDYEKYKSKIIEINIGLGDLELFYLTALWTVYTIQYENFNIPLLIAMAYGCPIIIPNQISLIEFVNDGIVIDCNNDKECISAYEKYYYDSDYRDKIIEKNKIRSSLFSWDKTVDDILTKMNEVEKKKNQTPLVTVITATYNLIKNGRREWFIQNLESVKKQTYNNIEHIVIDGASTDGTIDLLENYCNKGWITYYSEHDNGIYDAMNKGILKARGKYVVCLNSDDYYCEKKAVEWLVKKAEETDADATYGDAVRVEPESLKKMNTWKGRNYFLSIYGGAPCHQTFLIKTDVMKELNLYNTDYKVSADNVFFMRMIQHKKKFNGIDRLIVSFRDGGFSNSHLKQSTYERKIGQFKEYGQFHKLTQFDIDNLFTFKFYSLPLKEAIRLGSLLTYSGNPDWVERYFNNLFSYQMRHCVPLVIRGIRCLKKKGLLNTISICLMKIKKLIYKKEKID